MTSQEFVAQFTTSEQYTEDKWKPVTPSLHVTSKTTIGEIRSWMVKRGGERIQEFKVIIIEKQ